MWVLREPDDSEFERNALTFGLGALGGLAIGLLLAQRQRPQRVGQLGSELRDRVRGQAESVARRLRPGRLRRIAGDQRDLTDLEDRVLDAFLADNTLGERGIDVGAISRGILELSGSVWTRDEAERAVRVASGIPGVETVVNRLDIEEELEQGRRRRSNGREQGQGETQWQGRMVGMGRRRQGSETDPDRPDDSQLQTDEALREADEEQWQEEEISFENPVTAARPEAQSARGRTDYDEDELDNQDPHGKHARYTLDEQPQELNTSARVGEGLKTGTHLRLEHADVPKKPHDGTMETEGEDHDTGR